MDDRSRLTPSKPRRAAVAEQAPARPAAGLAPDRGVSAASPSPALSRSLRDIPVYASGQDVLQKRSVASAPTAPVNRTGLPTGLKSGIEALSGFSLDTVKVHYDSSRPAQLSASAFAQGTDIHVAPGQTRHLPHEAWHLVQQAQGRVRPTLQIGSGVRINDDAGLEREADAMGGRAARAGQAQGPAGALRRLSPASGSGGQPIQRALGKFLFDEKGKKVKRLKGDMKEIEEEVYATIERDDPTELSKDYAIFQTSNVNRTETVVHHNKVDGANNEGGFSHKDRIDQENNLFKLLKVAYEANKKAGKKAAADKKAGKTEENRAGRAKKKAKKAAALAAKAAAAGDAKGSPSKSDDKAPAPKSKNPPAAADDNSG